MLDTFFNRGGGADWKKYKGPYKFWIEDAETGETVVEKQVDLFKGEFEFVDAISNHPFSAFPIYTPNWKTENYLNEFPNEEWHVSLPTNHTYNIKCAYQSNDLISFCKTFSILDDEGNTLITAQMNTGASYQTASLLDYAFRKTMTLITEESGVSEAYILPMDQYLKDSGYYVKDLPSLEQNTDIIFNLAQNHVLDTVHEDSHTYVSVFPIPFYSTCFYNLSYFQYYELDIVMTPILE